MLGYVTDKLIRRVPICPSARTTPPAFRLVRPWCRTIFEELTLQLDRAAFLYGNAAYFDLERSRSAAPSTPPSPGAEGFVRRGRREPAPSGPTMHYGGNRAQRIEAEIVDFIQLDGSPLIDEVPSI